MNKTIIKTTLREIRKSLGRFISILCIIALGAGFFAGLKSSRGDMVKTADIFLKDHSFYDYKLINNYGFDDESIKTAEENENVLKAEGSSSVDALMTYYDTELAIKIATVPEKVNTLSLIKGRLPKNSNECVADKKFFGENIIGKEITLSDDNDKDTLDKLTTKTFTCVGIADSPVYLNYERGTTSLLNGSISAFIFVQKSSFESDISTELNLTLKKSFDIYSDDYNDYTKSVKGNIEELSKSIADERYESETKKPIEDYNKSKEEYEENLKKYEDEKAEDYKKLDDGLSEIKSSEKKLKDGKKTYDKSLDDYNKSLALFNESKKKLDEGKSELVSGIKKANEGIEKLKSGITQYEKAPFLDEVSKAKLEGLKAQLKGAEEELDSLNNQKTELDLKYKELGLQKKKLNEANSALISSKKQLDSSKAKLESSKDEYTTSKNKADEEYSKAKNDLDDAKIKLDDGKEKIDKIEKPESYTLGRDTNVGYVCFENDSKIVDGLAAVFPVFFFLVAALMCMTTMTRMVDEQRTDIGVLKALGYSKTVIMGKYVAYSGLAAIFGCLIGFFGGSYLFPEAIWIAYGVLYSFAPLEVSYDPIIAIGLMIVALIFTIGATILSCHSELSKNAAEIMRPKVPKSGKHTLIERLPFFKHLSFLRKVSFRNLVRYKGRFVFMVLGIAGCMALLVTGFGISDSIQKIGDYQFSDIMKYDYEVLFSQNMTVQNQNDFKKSASYAGNMIFVHSSSYDIKTPKGTKSSNVIATDSKNISDYINTSLGKEKVSFPKDGFAVVTKKFAENNGIGIGSEISVVDSDMKETKLKVSGICDNYVYNYVYTTLSSLKQGFSYEPSQKTAFINSKLEEDSDTAGKLMKEDKVRNVTDNAVIRTRVAKMLNSLDLIVLLVKVCAGALAFVVLYNLTNINITERIREIATIKVLGFYPKETSAYVFGENFVLTGIGAIIGIFLGKALHAFVMSKIVIDMVSFNVKVDLISYIYSIALTFIFALVVDFFMYFKLQKIDMAQSLKSIE